MDERGCSRGGEGPAEGPARVSLRPLLADSDLGQTLEEQGVVLLPGFLDRDLCERLRRVFTDERATLPYVRDGVHMTSWCRDLVAKLRVRDRLREAFATSTRSWLGDVRTLNHVFIVKQPGPETEFPVHQDWSVVDERRHASVNVWVPLHDVDRRTGALHVVRKSHHLRRPVRGAGLLFPNYRDVDALIRARTSLLEVPAGTAVVFPHSCIHGSPPNLGDHDRVAACFTAVPREAPLQIYFQSGAGADLEVHHPDDDFLYRYDDLREETLLRPPTPAPSERRPPYSMPPVTAAEILAAIGPVVDRD